MAQLCSAQFRGNGEGEGRKNWFPQQLDVVWKGGGERIYLLHYIKLELNSLIDSVLLSHLMLIIEGTTWSRKKITIN